MSADAEIDQIEETDPIRIVSEIERRVRPEGGGDMQIARRYHQAVQYACERFGVPFDVVDRFAPDDSYLGNAAALMNATKLAIDKLRIDLLSSKVRKESDGVHLDADWRSKIHSYLERVREIVVGSGVRNEIRDSILSRLAALKQEIDRVRTRTEKFTDVLVQLCEGLSEGAEGLKPAVKLFERVIGSLERLKRAGEPPPALPKPDSLGLPDYTQSPGDDRT